jgi:hypothetical protein
MGSGLYRCLWTSLSTPFVSAQRLSERTVYAKGRLRSYNSAITVQTSKHMRNIPFNNCIHSSITYIFYKITVLSKLTSSSDTVIASSGMPPVVSPKSPTGRHSKFGANPLRHRQWNAPGVFIHSLEARSH